MEKEETILKEFFYNPMKKFGVRELSRMTKLDTKTVMKYLHLSVQDKIIVKVKQKNKFTHYEANRLAFNYHWEKSQYLMKKIVKSDLLPYLEIKIHPKAIVLFGSVRKGTYHPKSDIDLFIQGKYQRLDLYNFEKKIGHEINLFFEENPQQNLSKGLLANIYNGIVLSGRLEVS